MQLSALPSHSWNCVASPHNFRGGQVMSLTSNFILEHLYEQWEGECGQELSFAPVFLSQEPGDACISVVPGAKVTCPTEFHVPKVPAVQRGEANVWGFVKSR